MHRSLPEQLELREMRYVISEPGRKQSPFVVVTNMLERSGEESVSAQEIAELYGYRWNVELDIRNIKTHLNMDFMRCKSPPMVNTEFWMKLLAYNLTRMTVGLAAKQESILSRQISFVSTCQYILSNWDVACFSALNPDELVRQILPCSAIRARHLCDPESKCWQISSLRPVPGTFAIPSRNAGKSRPRVRCQAPIDVSKIFQSFSGP